jgi:hypothetical protein
MINYKYNELEYAELVLKNGFQTKHIPTELRLLVLYFRDVLKLKPKQREKMIYAFCEKYIPEFKKEKYFKRINKALRFAFKKDQKLIDIYKVNIYQSEMGYINSLDIKYEYKKVLFTFLITYKINKFIYEYKNNKEYNSYYFKGGLKRYNNIYLLGSRPYNDIPSYLRYADVGVIPFIKNNFTDTVNPIKLFEYCAAGISVVSTNLRGVEELNSPAFIAKGYDEFCYYIIQAIKGKEETKYGNIEFAKENTWEKRYQFIKKTLGI